MPLTVSDFQAIANSTFFGSRDIAIGKDENAKLGNFVFSAGKDKNDAVMAAFKAALESEYGALGIHAFDTIVGQRNQLHKSLRACDVKATLSNLSAIKENRFIGEINRQLDSDPKMLELSQEMRMAVRQAIFESPFADTDLTACSTQADIDRAAADRISAAITQTRDLAQNNLFGGPEIDTAVRDIAGGKADAPAAKRNVPTGLRNLTTLFGKGKTSVEDQIKKGTLGVGMAVNRSASNPVLLQKLKTNGVEPGFIYTNDWSLEDSKGFLADIDSDESMRALDELKRNNPAFKTQCEGKSICEQIMLAGRAHPAGMAAVSEYMIEKGMADPSSDIYNAFCEKFPQVPPEDWPMIDMAVIKKTLFVQIRDAVMNVKPKLANGADNPEYAKSPIFRHFNERHIVKLDYNENDRIEKLPAAHAGEFQRPERILTTRKPILGQIYRLQTAASADDISAGAVTEALANDLTRLAGVPSQELQIVRGEYSDGHPKLMLEAKFADGYKDMEAGFIQDGRIVPPPGKDGKPQQLESLGKYKAFFLLTADRDAVGKRGQNKGFAHGEFFAIDPGHSLEGNGKYLEIADDFSFKDTYGKSTKPRFKNFSVFDDDTRFAKFQGLLNLREVAQSGAFDKLFADYRAAFDPNEKGISDAEKALRTKVLADIGKKEAEFKTQLSRLMKIGGMQLELYDRLAADGPAMQEGAINTLSHLEMLTSPTTWVSKHGKVALTHLEVKPETRIPWRAGVEENNIVYHCDKPLSAKTRSLIETLARTAGATLETDAAGITRLTVPKNDTERFFAIFSEENVQKLTHPEEYVARLSGEDALKVAKDYTPAPFVKAPDPPTPLTADQLPDSLDVEVDGVIVQYPKIHYEQLALTVSPSSSIPRPQNVEQLKAFLEARVRRGLDILNAVRDGDINRFEPSRDNMIALTHALHHLALRQGQYMYRGSFSIADPEGRLARWLDGSPDLYARASTHAKPYHSMIVDGHRNEARGFDSKINGMGGLLNGMRTFHYFTIPDTDHLQDAGGSGPKRRLFLKCETFGVFVNKISSANAKASLGDDIKPRGYIFGDIFESFEHGLSLINSYTTPKEQPGIHKENLLDRQKAILATAERKLIDAGLRDISERLLAGDVRGGAGVRKLFENLGEIYDNHMPEDEGQRAQAAAILDELLNDLAETMSQVSGPESQRLGNEIMID